MVSFYAFPVIFIDTILFRKGTLIKRACVRTPWTPTGSAPGTSASNLGAPSKRAKHSGQRAMSDVTDEARYVTTGDVKVVLTDRRPNAVAGRTDRQHCKPVRLPVCPSGITLMYAL